MALKIAPSPRSLAVAWNPHHHRYSNLYHGCLRKDATAMLASGISHSVGHADADFGLGFYTTTIRGQAEDWAYLKHKGESLLNRGRPNFQPVVVWLRVPRAELSRLETMAFVRGHYDAEEYWSFVQHCRASIRKTLTTPAVVHHHERDATGTPTWYDLVCGPVAAFWQQRSAMLDSDQYSFHTAAGVRVLNDVVAGGLRGVDYGVDVVTV